jgi:hypothetical protein
MTEPTIICPKCKTEIKLTESLAAPIIEATREKYRLHLQSEMAKVQDREAAVQQQMQELAQTRTQLEAQIEDRIAAERTKIAVEESKKARLILEGDLKQREAEVVTLKEALSARDQKLEAAQKAQADIVQKERDLEDARREVDLTVQKRVTEMLGQERERTKKEVEDSLMLKVREKEEQIASLSRKIEELQRKSEQGSQQLQGEVFELELEDTLRRQFPSDTFEAVAKGELGADLLQTVNGAVGASAGTILWELKRTRNWSDGWLPKLRGDQRASNADIALLVSQALPKGTLNFDLVDGVWVTGPQCVFPLAIALREQLLCVAAAKRAGEGQLTKMELIYEYLTGPRFRHRVEAIVEQFKEMQRDLERERAVITKQWAKRDQQIRSVLGATAGMHGDLHGIAGQSIQEVEGLSLELLAGPTEADTTEA